MVKNYKLSFFFLTKIHYLTNFKARTEISDGNKGSSSNKMKKTMTIFPESKNEKTMTIFPFIKKMKKTMSTYFLVPQKTRKK
jgi:hypothetical protein